MKVLLLTAATILGVSAVLILLTTSVPAAQTSEASASGTPLGPADTYFVTQTSLGTPFQVDSGRLAETKGTTEAIRNYAELMVSSHITVNNALLAILKSKAPVPPPTLLKAAYATIVSNLQHETGQALDADYVRGQVNCTPLLRMIAMAFQMAYGPVDEIDVQPKEKSKFANGTG